jgi:UDP-2,3-diacylglucosamine pyrophosphatase LpxH
MSNLFKRAICFTDIHFGLKGNSVTHNEDCLNFVKWAIALGRERGCDTAIFLGDWHNNRSSINVLTLNYSLEAIEALSKGFDRVHFIPGNHDLYYRDRRDTQSVSWARNVPNINIVNNFYTEGDVTIVPWLVGEDWKRLQKDASKYMFGHFELPNFYMNAMVKMPEVGEVRAGHFQGVENVFSGHFHKRQTDRNITYMGNCFPHNYADAGDDERGAMILAWGQEPEFVAWPDAPQYRILGLASLIDNADELLKPKSHVRVNIDIDISYEEANFIKETFVGKYQLRELSLIPAKNEEHAVDLAPGEIKFESVDQIVSNQLTNIESDFYDPNLLIQIYREL